MIELFEIFSWLVTMIVIVVMLGLIAYVGFIIVMVIGKLVWMIIKEPCREIYFDYIDWKMDIRRKRKKKLKWYEDYSKMR